MLKLAFVALFPLVSCFWQLSNRKYGKVHVTSAINDNNLASASDAVVDLKSQVFCNVELNCEHIEAVGFDMDFTLAQYNQAFDLLAFEGAKDKLYRIFGYPKVVLDLTYKSDLFRRGIIIDIKRGNFLKVDRHKYVRKAYHGLTEMSKLERKIYSQEVTTFTESNYVYIDTLFLLIDAILFANLIDIKDKNPSLIAKPYAEIYKDIRSAVDMCHKDGCIKEVVMQYPSEYILYDDSLVRLLIQLREAGKKVAFTTSFCFLTVAFFHYLDFSLNK